MDILFRKRNGESIVKEGVETIYLPLDEGPIMWVGVDGTGKHDLIVTVQDSADLLEIPLTPGFKPLILVDRNSMDNHVGVVMDELRCKLGGD